MVMTKENSEEMSKKDERNKEVWEEQMKRNHTSVLDGLVMGTDGIRVESGTEHHLLISAQGAGSNNDLPSKSVVKFGYAIRAAHDLVASNDSKWMTAGGTVESLMHNAVSQIEHRRMEYAKILFIKMMYDVEIYVCHGSNELEVKSNPGSPFLDGDSVQSGHRLLGYGGTEDDEQSQKIVTSMDVDAAMDKLVAHLQVYGCGPSEAMLNRLFKRTLSGESILSIGDEYGDFDRILQTIIKQKMIQIKDVQSGFVGDVDDTMQNEEMHIQRLISELLPAAYWPVHFSIASYRDTRFRIAAGMMVARCRKRVFGEIIDVDLIQGHLDLKGGLDFAFDSKYESPRSLTPEKQAHISANCSAMHSVIVPFIGKPYCGVSDVGLVQFGNETVRLYYQTTDEQITVSLDERFSTLVLCFPNPGRICTTQYPYDTQGIAMTGRLYRVGRMQVEGPIKVVVHGSFFTTHLQILSPGLVYNGIGSVCAEVMSKLVSGVFSPMARKGVIQLETYDIGGSHIQTDSESSERKKLIHVTELQLPEIFCGHDGSFQNGEQDFTFYIEDRMYVMTLLDMQRLPKTYRHNTTRPKTYIKDEWVRGSMELDLLSSMGAIDPSRSGMIDIDEFANITQIRRVVGRVSMGAVLTEYLRREQEGCQIFTDEYMHVHGGRKDVLCAIDPVLKKAYRRCAGRAVLLNGKGFPSHTSRNAQFGNNRQEIFKQISLLLTRWEDYLTGPST